MELGGGSGGVWFEGCGRRRWGEKPSAVQYHNGALHLQKLPMRPSSQPPRSDIISIICYRSMCALSGGSLSDSLPKALLFNCRQRGYKGLGRVSHDAKQLDTGLFSALDQSENLGIDLQAAESSEL